MERECSLGFRNEGASFEVVTGLKMVTLDMLRLSATRGEGKAGTPDPTPLFVPN